MVKSIVTKNVSISWQYSNFLLPTLIFWTICIIVLHILLLMLLLYLNLVFVFSYVFMFYIT